MECQGWLLDGGGDKWRQGEGSEGRGGQFWFCVVCMPRTADTGEVRLSGLAMA